VIILVLPRLQSFLNRGRRYSTSACGLHGYAGDENSKFDGDYQCPDWRCIADNTIYLM